MQQPVRRRTQYDDAEWQTRHVLLLKTSHRVAASRISSPFSMPVQPSPRTVWTSWPGSSAAKSTGRFSSSSTRTGQQRVASGIERRDRLFARHRRELTQELVERVAGEHRRSAKNVRVTVNDRGMAHIGRPVKCRSSVYTGRGADSPPDRAMAVRQYERDRLVAGVGDRTAERFSDNAGQTILVGRLGPAGDPSMPRRSR